MPAEVIADCLNCNLRFGSKTEAALLGNRRRAGAVTGPHYGRIRNADIVDMLIERFGDGVSGDWRVPGEFGKRVTVDRQNTTLYASDRDMFVFLADEERRIEVPARRDGQPGSLARGFFVWNTEVGDKTLGAAFFLFDYADAPQPRTVRASDRFRDQRHDLLPQEVAAVPPGEACHGHDGKPSQSRALTPEAPSPSAL